MSLPSRLAMLAAGALMPGSPLMAGVTQQALSLPLALEYDSNPGLASDSSGEVWRLKAAPRYTLAAISGVDEFKADLAVRVERSSDEALSANREDPDLILGWKRERETGEFGARLKYEEASTRFTELTESGLVAADATRTAASLGGNWRAALSERSRLALEADYSKVSYDGGSFIDYTNSSASLTLGYAWSERSEPYARVAASHYEPDDAITASSDNYGALLGMKWRASERLDWNVEAGVARTSGQSDATAWQGNAALHYLGPRTDLSFELGRYVSASSEGGFAESDQVRGAWAYAMSERTRAGFEVSWREYRGLTPSTIKQFGAWISHELSLFWSARLDYRFQQQDQTAVEASANLVSATLLYTNPDL